MSDSTPTVKFPAASPATPATEGGPSRRLLIILISVGAALLIAILILLIALLGRGNGDPVAAPTESATSPSPTPTVTETSPTPSATPSVTPTEDAPPPPPAPEPEPEPASPIKSFSVNDTSVDCDSAESVTLTFSWNTTGQTLWFGVGTNNAKTGGVDTFPLVHELDFDYQCGQSSGQQIYTITVEQSNGDLLSKTITITE